MKSLIFSIALVIAVASCKQEDPAYNKEDKLLTADLCRVTDPVNDLAWLKALTEDLNTGDIAQYNYLYKGVYNGQVVFVTGNCCPFCMTIPIAYTCDGKKVEDFDFKKLTKSEVFWKSDNNECQFNN